MTRPRHHDPGRALVGPAIERLVEWTTLDELADMSTVEEVAAFCRISRSAAYEAVRRGQIPSVRLGRRLRVPKAALLRVLSVAD